MTTASLTHKCLAIGQGKFNNRKPLGFGFGGLLLTCLFFAFTSTRLHADVAAYMVLNPSTFYFDPTEVISISAYCQNNNGDAAYYVEIDSPVGTPVPNQSAEYTGGESSCSVGFTPPAAGSYTFYFMGETNSNPSLHVLAQVTATFLPGPPPSAGITTNLTNYDESAAAYVMAVGQTADIHASFTFPAGDSSLGSNIYESYDVFPASPSPLQDGSAQASRDYSYMPMASGTYTFYAYINTSLYPWRSYATINVEVDGPPNITTQPVSQTVKAYQPFSFIVTVAPIGAGNPVANSYQWQSSADGGVTWSNLSDGAGFAGTNTAQLSQSYADIGANNNQFRCLVTNRYGNTYSNQAILTVTPGSPPPGIPTLPPWALASFVVLIFMGAKATLTKRQRTI